MPNRKNQNNNKRRIPEVVKDFAKADWPKFKKKEKKYYDSKKELRSAYCERLLSDLPITIDWLIRNSHIQEDEVQEVAAKCYKKFTGDSPEENTIMNTKKEEDFSKVFIKYLIKSIKEFGPSIDNIEMLPIIVHEAIAIILRWNAECETTGKEPIDPNPLFDLSDTLLGKRLKKAKKKGIPESLAFDLLGVLPEKDAMRYSPQYRIMCVFKLIYAHADNLQTVKIDKIFRFVFDERDYERVIKFALLEKKERFKNSSECERKVFNDISAWVFTELENMDNGDIRNIIMAYINARKRDAAQGKDGARRYHLASLPESEYPIVCKAIDSIKKNDNNGDIIKYL